MSEELPLAGLRIALPETRELDLLASMIERQGGVTLRCPLVAILDTEDVAAVEQWLDLLQFGQFTDVLFYTGEGLRRLLAFADRRGSRDAMVHALARVRKFCRGPKPARALREIDLSPEVRIEPATTAGIVSTFQQYDWNGRRLGIQLFDQSVPEQLAEFLTATGVEYRCVSPYRYAPASDEERVVELIDQLANGQLDVIAFTSAAQVDRLFEVASKRQATERLESGLNKATVAAVGPVAAQTLHDRGVAVQATPQDKYFMRPLVDSIIAATRKQ